MKRKNFEISAGSMADIAFLLLIFFLVSTTIEKDKGYVRTLAAKNNGPRPEVIPPENVFDVQLNNSNQLMVENIGADSELMKQKLRRFYLANSPLGKHSAQEPLWTLSEKYPGYLGLNEKAFINIHPQMKTDYKSYMQVQSAIEEVVHEVRNEIGLHYFGQTYDYLLEHKEVEFEKLNILKSIVPIRIMDRSVVK
jgi:hypothetical protein